MNKPESKLIQGNICAPQRSQICGKSILIHKNRGGNILPVETHSAQICGFHIDHIAGSFSLIFAVVINIPFACCLGQALGAGVRFQNPLEAISSFITISHSRFRTPPHTLPPTATPPEFSPIWPRRPLQASRPCRLPKLWSAAVCLREDSRILHVLIRWV